jgi:hypothetical protein
MKHSDSVGGRRFSNGKELVTNDEKEIFSTLGLGQFCHTIKNSAIQRPSHRTAVRLLGQNHPVCPGGINPTEGVRGGDWPLSRGGSPPNS